MKRAFSTVIPAILAAILGGMLLLFTGNTHEPARYGPSALTWLIRQWRDPGSNSSHGWLVPAVSLALVWMKHGKLARASKRTDWLALGVIVPALLLFWAGCRSQQPRLSVMCIIALSWGIPFLLWGRNVAAILLFPCVYLLFAMPMGFLSAVTFPLRRLSTMLSTAVLNGLGIAVERVGTAICSAEPGKYALDVGDACSGLQSLIAMSALTAAFAYVTQRGLVRKWLLFLSAIPIAMIGNTVRIVTIGIVAETIGTAAAMRIYHDFSGYIVFGTAVVLMTFFGAVIGRDYSFSTASSAGIPGRSGRPVRDGGRQE